MQMKKNIDTTAGTRIERDKEYSSTSIYQYNFWGHNSVDTSNPGDNIA